MAKRKMPAKVELDRRSMHMYHAVSKLEKLPTRTLQSMRARLLRATSSNIWWATYWLAPILLKEIKGEFYRRQRVRELARKLTVENRRAEHE